MSTLSLGQARRLYAEELRRIGPVTSDAVIEAFATVPREDFLGPAPWTLLGTGGARPAESSDPHDLYRNVLVPIDPARQINNGEPRLWAFLDDLLGLTGGERVLHIGAGTGYYSAILAEIVGRTGQLIAIEIEPDLAARTRENLAPWPQARTITADGFSFRPEQPVDAIVVNAGVNEISPAWLDGLTEGGRLMVPLTTARWLGAFLLITRLPGKPGRHAVRYACPTSIIPCAGRRDEHAEARLIEALTGDGFEAIRSLRRPPEPPDDTCWLAGDGWWLSTAPP